jgi:hypothetical protein
MGLDFATIASIAFGGLITVAVAMLVEKLKRPCLELYVGDALDLVWNPQREKASARFLNVLVKNTASAPGWMMPATAHRCKATIEFFDENRNPQLGEFSSMLGRWGSAPEPVPVPFRIGAPAVIQTADGLQHVSASEFIGWMPDFAAILDQQVSIFQGTAEGLNIVAQFEDEQDCYAWCNDNYIQWDLPQRKFGIGKYQVRVTVETMGIRRSRWFRLINEGHRRRLHLDGLEYEGVDDGSDF